MPFLRQHKWEVVICCILTALVFLVFGKALSAEFVPWDDDVNIYANPNLGPLSAERIHWMFTDLTYQWRYQPLSWFTWSLIYGFAGLNPLPYHLANLLFHAANTCLVFFLIAHLLRRTFARTADQHALLWCSGIAAGIWALHPLRVETVAWAVELLYCQASFFLLISYWCYLHAYEGKTHWGWYAGSVIAFTASLLSFPLGLAFVAVLIVIDVFLFRRIGPGSWTDARALRTYSEKLPFIAITLAATFLNFYTRTHAPGWAGPVSLDEFGLLERVMQACYIWAYYVWKQFLPINLSPVYTQLVFFEPVSLATILSCVLLVGISIVVFLARARMPLLIALWGCHLAVLVPKLGLTEHPHYPSDRYSLVVSVVWVIALAFGLVHLWSQERFRRPVIGISLIVLALLSVSSWRQTGIWRNGETLFTAIIDRLPDDRYLADPLCRRGLWYAERGDFSKAEADLRASIKVDPEYPVAGVGLAEVLASQGKNAEAIQWYATELKQDPSNVRALTGLALAHAAEGNVNAAKEAFSRAWSLAPKEITIEQRIEIYRRIGAAYARSGDTAMAAEFIRFAINGAEGSADSATISKLRQQLEKYQSGQR